MKIEVKKKTWLLTDADCVEFAYGIDKFPYSEELLECENNIPHVTWEHVYIMHIMKIMMQFPNSTITCNQSVLGENQTTIYSVTNYMVSVINDVGIECATYVSPFKSLLQLNGCKTNRLIESLLLTKFGNIRNVHYTVDNDNIILVKLDTIKMMYSVPDVASMIGVTSRTLYNWCCSNNVVNYHRTENGRIYFTNDDVDSLQQSIVSGNIQLKHRGKRHKKKEEKNEKC